MDEYLDDSMPGRVMAERLVDAHGRLGLEVSWFHQAVDDYDFQGATRALELIVGIAREIVRIGSEHQIDMGN